MDRLRFREQKRIKKDHVAKGMDPKEATAQAKIDCIAVANADYEKSCVEVLRSMLPPEAWKKYCAVSIKGTPRWMYT